MPADTFKEVLYQKLQFPLYFEVKNIMKARVNESTILLALWIFDHVPSILAHACFLFK
jgi:hypothetical protein